MQNENGGSLLDALKGGMPGLDDDDTPEGEEAPTGEEEVVEETPEGEEAEGEETPEEEAEGEETPEGEEEAEEGEEAEGEEAEQEQAPPKKGAKEPDPINDPLPKGTLQSTTERFAKIREIVKQKDVEITTLRSAAEERDELVRTITDSGMDAQKFQVMLEYASGVNSNDPVAMRRSYEILTAELQHLATALGEPMPGQDLLEGHPDLQKLVAENKTTPEIAREVAATRNRHAAEQRLRQTHGGEIQRRQQAQRAQNEGRTALTALGKELKLRDGDAEYRRKAALVVGMLQQTMPNVPPQLWAKTFRNVYDKLPTVRRAAPTGGKPGQRPQPQRGNKRPAGNSTVKAPKNLAEAIRGAFK